MRRFIVLLSMALVNTLAVASSWSEAVVINTEEDWSLRWDKAVATPNFVDLWNLLGEVIRHKDFPQLRTCDSAVLDPEVVRRLEDLVINDVLVGIEADGRSKDLGGISLNEDIPGWRLRYPEGKDVDAEWEIEWRDDLLKFIRKGATRRISSFVLLDRRMDWQIFDYLVRVDAPRAFRILLDFRPVSSKYHPDAMVGVIDGTVALGFSDWFFALAKCCKCDRNYSASIEKDIRSFLNRYTLFYSDNDEFGDDYPVRMYSLDIIESLSERGRGFEDLLVKLAEKPPAPNRFKYPSTELVQDRIARLLAK